MANKLYDEAHIQDIADAIREKNGSSATYKVSQMGAAVRAISTTESSGNNEFAKELIERTVTTVSADELSGIDQIGIYAFSSCNSLKSITIPDSVTTIGNYAFYYCTSLTNITIPDSVTSIGNYAINNCRSLTSVTIPDSVTTIGSAAFYGCYNLTSITIPDSVIKIGSNAFGNCYDLTDIYLNPTTPPSLGNTNVISSATTTIHVPVGYGDTYKAATNWSSFADIIVEDIIIT
jgi:hypothetical protein